MIKNKIAGIIGRIILHCYRAYVVVFVKTTTYNPGIRSSLKKQYRFYRKNNEMLAYKH